MSAKQPQAPKSQEGAPSADADSYSAKRPERREESASGNEGHSETPAGSSSGASRQDDKSGGRSGTSSTKK